MLKLENIKKIYNNKIILRNVSLLIPKNEIIGLLGVNGAGKSTLANIITGLKPCETGGDILYQNESIYTHLYAYKKIVGYCPQKPNLNTGMTLFDNLYYSGLAYGLTKEQVHENIHFITANLDIKKYLTNYEYILSGGYKQRFMIARSLIHMPKILILDEPTVGMDPAMRIALWNFMKVLKNQGLTIILTTHYLDEAEELCDRVCFLNNGMVDFFDTPQNLLKKTNQKNLEKVWLELAKNNIEMEL